MVELFIREKYLEITQMYNHKTYIFVNQAIYKRWKTLELLKISVPLKYSQNAHESSNSIPSNLS